MSYGTIISEQGDGRYTVEVDMGEAQRLALREAAQEEVARQQLLEIKAQNALDDADEQEAEQRASVAAAINELIDAQADDPQMSSAATKVIQNALDREYKKLAFIRAKNLPLRLQLAKIKNAKAVAIKRFNLWDGFQAKFTRQMWCTDYTEGATGFAGVMEMNGEQDLLIITPGAVPLANAQLKPRELTSPEQAYWNVAALPGWQKYKPTYRTGVLTAIDFDTDTAGVTLDAALSSAQRLDINQSASLENVPVSYMECNADAFKVGDRVVVAFQDQNWESPEVIGFVDNPKPCIQWPRVWITLRQFRSNYTPASRPTQSVYGALYSNCAGSASIYSPFSTQGSDPVDYWYGFLEDAELRNHTGTIDLDDFELDVTYSNVTHSIGTETCPNGYATMTPGATATRFQFINPATCNLISWGFNSQTATVYGGIGDKVCEPLYSTTAFIPNDAGVDVPFITAVENAKKTEPVFSGTPSNWAPETFPTVSVTYIGGAEPVTRQYSVFSEDWHPIYGLGWRITFHTRARP